MENSENEKPEAKVGTISVAPVSRCSSFLCSEATTEAEQFEGSLRVELAFLINCLFLFYLFIYFFRLLTVNINQGFRSSVWYYKFFF